METNLLNPRAILPIPEGMDYMIVSDSPELKECFEESGVVFHWVDYEPLGIPFNYLNRAFILAAGIEQASLEEKYEWLFVGNGRQITTDHIKTINAVIENAPVGTDMIALPYEYTSFGHLWIKPSLWKRYADFLKKSGVRERVEASNVSSTYGMEEYMMARFIMEQFPEVNITVLRSVGASGVFNDVLFQDVASTQGLRYLPFFDTVPMAGQVVCGSTMTHGAKQIRTPPNSPKLTWLQRKGGSKNPLPAMRFLFPENNPKLLVTEWIESLIFSKHAFETHTGRLENILTGLSAPFTLQWYPDLGSGLLKSGKLRFIMSASPSGLSLWGSFYTSLYENEGVWEPLFRKKKMRDYPGRHKVVADRRFFRMHFDGEFQPNLPPQMEFDRSKFEFWGNPEAMQFVSTGLGDEPIHKKESSCQLF